jgi:uncharacterized small protein (DUF1192 family)
MNENTKKKLVELTQDYLSSDKIREKIAFLQAELEKERKSEVKNSLKSKEVNLQLNYYKK